MAAASLKKERDGWFPSECLPEKKKNIRKIKILSRDIAKRQANSENENVNLEAERLYITYMDWLLYKKL